MTGVTTLNPMNKPVTSRIDWQVTFSTPNALILSVVALAIVGWSAAAAGHEQAPSYFGASPGALAQSKERLAAGDPLLRPALDALVERAEQALKVKPPSVAEKQKTGASGDVHDYYSQAPYFWPDPDSPDGLPYIARDGRVNPEARGGSSDPERLDLMGETVETLALAYYFTGKEAYAEHATRCLRVWFLDPATRMTPHMNYAQAVPGKNTGRGIGIIETGGIIEAGDVADLLAKSPAWLAEDDAALRAWLGEFLDWLLTSENGLNEAGQKQNHGTMYDYRTARLALMLGRPKLAKQIIEAAKQKRIAVQIEPDGSQPLELRRTKSFNYSRLNLRGLCALATLGEWIGVDLWSFETSDGRSIRQALEFMYPYVSDPDKEWPYQQIVRIDRSELAVALRQAAIAYSDPRYEALVRALPGTGDSLIQLLYPASASESRAPSPLLRRPKEED